jgi:hypothetical protein
MFRHHPVEPATRNVKPPELHLACFATDWCSVVLSLVGIAAGLPAVEPCVVVEEKVSQRRGSLESQDVVAAAEEEERTDVAVEGEEVDTTPLDQ